MGGKYVPEENKVHLQRFFPERESFFDRFTIDTPKMVYGHNKENLKKILKDSGEIPPKQRAKLVDIGDDF